MQDLDVLFLENVYLNVKSVLVFCVMFKIKTNSFDDLKSCISISESA